MANSLEAVMAKYSGQFQALFDRAVADEVREQLKEHERLGLRFSDTLTKLESTLSDAFSTARAQLNGKLKNGTASAASKSRKSVDMNCRVEGCTERSKGPRGGFMCAKHGKELSKAEQRKAREQWNKKHQEVRA